MEKNLKNIEIYTDGACSYNPGPGGWGCVLIYNENKKQLSGFEENTTNNRMEMFAIIKALSELNQSCNINLYSDSAYVVNAFNENWIENWISKNWKTSNNKEVKNVDLWKDLLKLVKMHNISWHKVKGHSDNKYNNICDKLARGEVDKWLQQHPDFQPPVQNELDD